MHKYIITFLLASSISNACFAYAYALEFTQWLNNFELVTTNISQAELVAVQAKEYALQLEQQIERIKNMANVPRDVIQKQLQPYIRTAEKIRELRDHIQSFKHSVEDVRTVYTRRIEEMKNLNLNPEEYMRAEINLAKVRGGEYKKSLDEDMISLGRVAEEAQGLQESRSQIEGIDGNLKGFKVLAQQSHMLASIMMDVKSSVIKANSLSNEKAINEISNEERDNMMRELRIKKNNEERERIKKSFKL